MCLSTLFCADDDGSFLNLRFENDVKMYGTETGEKEHEHEVCLRMM